MRHGSIFLCILAGFALLMLLSCGEHEFDNPFSSDYALQSIEGFTVTQLTDSSVKLTWQQNPDIIGNDLIQRKANTSCSWGDLATVNANVVQYTDTELSTSNTYYYRLYGCNDQNRTNAQETYISTTFASITSFNVELTSLTSTELTWVHDCSYVSQYVIERQDITERGGVENANQLRNHTARRENTLSSRKTTNVSSKQTEQPRDGYEVIATVGSSVRTYTDTSVLPNHQYQYRIHAVSDYNTSNSMTDDVEITFPALTNLEVTQTSLSSCQLTWEYEALGGEEGFKIERKVGSGSWSQIADVSIGTLSYDDEGLETEVEYSYRVYAYTSDYTGNAAEESITLDDIPDNMILVPSGSFQMGRTGVATPIHTVNLNAFYIGPYEVTQQEWVDVMGSNPSHFTGDMQRPVEEVSWYSVVKYCNYRSIQEGLTPVYSVSGDTNPDNWGSSFTPDVNWSANGYRLPTEAEWEYAARGCTNNPDYLYAGSDTCGDVAWYGSNSGYTTHAAGDDKDPVTYPGNGVTYNMSGNVWEWCWDLYGSYTSGAQTNPHGPDSGSNRVLRGGYWNHNAYRCEVASRDDRTPSDSYYGIGFRLCRTAE